MDEKIRYHSHKLEREEDLFCSALNYAGTNTTVINQVEYSDVFYSTYYFSDGNLTDINIYYVTSKKLQNEINHQQSNIIKFDPGTRNWSTFKGEMRDTSTWLFVLRVLFTSSMEIEEIRRLESEYKRWHKSHQPVMV